MYSVVYMKADYEPWYQFEEWQSHILDSWSFQTETEAQAFLVHKVEEFKESYTFSKEKNGFYAFWDGKEVCYCEDCEEDLQLYHGLFITSELAE